jgi:hypothetical protein
MQYVVWVETMIAGQSVAVRRAAVVERQCLANVPTKLGPTLQEGRAVLTGIEQEVVQSQVELQSGAASVCEHCQGRLRIKDIRKRRLDTVFGRVTVSCRRFIRCTCRGGVPHSIWPLASWGLLGMKRSKPERMYLLAQWGSKLPYRRAAELLNEMLPGLNRRISHTAIRRHTLAVGLTGPAHPRTRRVRQFRFSVTPRSCCLSIDDRDRRYLCKIRSYQRPVPALRSRREDRSRWLLRVPICVCCPAPGRRVGIRKIGNAQSWIDGSITRR